MAEPKDMREIFEEKKRKLEGTVTETVLSEEQRELLVIGIEFGYSAAYCQRTCDMQQAFSQANRYSEMYEQTLAFIRGIQ